VGPSTPEQSADVVVIGGGIIGLAVAWRARSRGLDVVLCDRGELPSEIAAAHVAAGMLAPVAEAESGERALLALGLESARRWPAFAAELSDVSGVDVDYRPCGALVVARDRDEAEHVERELALRERLGLHVERLVPSQARTLEPALAPSLRAAFRAPDDHAVDPRAVCAALVVAARDAGVTLRTNTNVQSVAAGEGVVLDSGERIAAGHVVIAAGAWSGGIDGAPVLPVRPVKGQVLRLRPRAGEVPLLEGVVRWDGGYLVPRSDGRVILGATMEEQGFDVTVTALAVHELLREASERVPGVLDLELEGVLAGLRPAAPDNAPLIGMHEGVMVATGHHRNGVLLTPVTADLVAAELAGETQDHVFGPGRFSEVAVVR
jgi:glycine oxidase